MCKRSVFSGQLPGLAARADADHSWDAGVRFRADRAHARASTCESRQGRLPRQRPGASPQRAQTAPPQTRRLTIEEAVKLALENNLGIQIARYDPQVDDYSVVQAKAAWAPTFQNTFQKNSQDSPNNSFLAGGVGGKTTNSSFSNSTGVNQQTPWGGNYSVSWDASRLTTNSTFTTFSPQLRSGLSFSVQQPHRAQPRHRLRCASRCSSA